MFVTWAQIICWEIQKNDISRPIELRVYSIILYSLLDNAHDKFLKNLKVSLGENNNIVCR